jgi:membrane protein
VEELSGLDPGGGSASGAADGPATGPAPGVVHPRKIAKPRSRRDRIRVLERWYLVLTRSLHRTVLSVGAHDCLNLAQSTAYSAIVALFPALIVAAAVIGLLPDTAPVRFQLAAFFDRVLPPGVTPLLDAAFENSPKHAHSVRALVTAGIVSFAGASNVISTLMEGLRRARELPPDCWSFWKRRRRAFELVPLSLVPLTIASLLVVFGHAVTGWLASNIGPDVRASIYAIALLTRWAVALGASVGLIGLLYQLGVPSWPVSVPVLLGRPRRLDELQSGGAWSELTTDIFPRSWRMIVPGAVMATAMWFLTTLAFGWYVTRFANYSEVYGSLGAGIALLFWLYIISLSVLCGAEFNAQFDSQFHAHFGEARAETHASPDGEIPLAEKRPQS